jgi:hypothetical protein
MQNQKMYIDHIFINNLHKTLSLNMLLNSRTIFENFNTLNENLDFQPQILNNPSGVPRISYSNLINLPVW